MDSDVYYDIPIFSSLPSIIREPADISCCCFTASFSGLVTSVGGGFTIIRQLCPAISFCHYLETVLLKYLLNLLAYSGDLRWMYAKC